MLLYRKWTNKSNAYNRVDVGVVVLLLLLFLFCFCSAVVVVVVADVADVAVVEGTVCGPSL